jgi:hypothetical protein
MVLKPVSLQRVRTFIVDNKNCNMYDNRLARHVALMVMRRAADVSANGGSGQD